MPTIQRPGAIVEYDVQGNGPVVLLGHSLLCDRHMWDGVVPRLASRYRVISVDARAHGNSIASAPFTLEDLAGDIGAILDREGVARAVVGGLSMGGMSAMRFALAAPDRVEALLLLDTNADPEDRVKRLRYHLLGRIVRTFGHVGWVYGIALNILLGETTQRERPQVVEVMRRRLLDNDPKSLHLALSAVFDRGSILAELHRIAAPALVLVGDEDTATPRVKSERIAAAIPKAELRTVPQAGHLSALEDPEAVAAELLAFLDRRAARAA